MVGRKASRVAEMIEIHKKMEPDEADTREMKGKRQEEQKVQREQQRKEPMPELKHQKLTAQAEKRREISYGGSMVYHVMIVLCGHCYSAS